jgi:hypothetical protein
MSWWASGSRPAWCPSVGGWVGSVAPGGYAAYAWVLYPVPTLTQAPDGACPVTREGVAVLTEVHGVSDVLGYLVDVFVLFDLVSVPLQPHDRTIMPSAEIGRSAVQRLSSGLRRDLHQSEGLIERACSTAC